MRFTLLAAAGMLLGIGQAVVVSSDPGSFSVAMRVKALTDHGRIDPLNNTEKRRVLLSVFWPISNSTKCSQDMVPYMPPATAASYGPLAESAGLPANIFSSFQLEFCQLPQNGGCRASGRKASRFPLVLFSPGLAESRLLYSVTAKSIAAQGYVVVTIDHPYDTEVVEFPDGSVARNNGTDGMEQRLTEIRAADISFTLSALRGLAEGDSLFQGLPGKINFMRVVAMGHSLGGAAAAQALRDQRIRGGIDLDGRLFSPVLEAGLDRPFLLLGREKHAEEDATWNQFWSVLRGPRALLGVSGTTHASFTDIPPLIQSLGLPDAAQSQVEKLLGTVGGSRMQHILAELCSSFFVSVFEGDYHPLEHTASGFSEVSIRNSSFKAV
ncbi:Alpha/Beta hydrolase protein [Chaetomidium leptoderma]|uniref:1-alkyl-2-acetylglycerophosphocholine esterase n=1 Tax=Chaetomidium leptoderma TaxID=669021 RepID=A0AAN6VWM2_9PEZI|nr:Alpha/Beta hydrolase protein [Chaetomidium leptoderma]